MDHFVDHSGFARLRPPHARAVLLTAAVSAALLVGITFSPLRSGYADAGDRGPGDIALYRAEAERIQAGAGYYDAAASELRTRGYPTRSIFNWRMPLPVWLIGALPEMAFAKAILGIASLALLLLAFDCLYRERGRAAALLCMFFMSGAVLPCVLGDLFVMPELWSGVFIGLSIVAWGCQWRTLGVLAAVAALFLRELAAPYYVVCLVLAVYERRRGEALSLGAGLLSYLIYFAVHVGQVLPLIGPADRAHPEGWIQFGGAGFVLSTVQMNGYLLLLPQWVTALFLVATLVGFASWNSCLGTRAGLTAALYVMAFSIAGQSFNQYWGSMTAPLYCLGAAACPRALSELWRSAGFRRFTAGGVLDRA